MRNELQCPHCKGSLSWVRPVDLERVPFLWRCAPGQEPKTFQLRCRECTNLVVVYESPDRSPNRGDLVVIPNGVEETRKLTRERTADPFDDD